MKRVIKVKNKTTMKKNIILLYLVGLSLGILAQTPADIAVRLDSVLGAYAKQNQFNGCVLVSKKGEIIFNKGYGLANPAFSIPNNENTKFKLASVSKQFTATGILLLEQEGKLNVNDTLGKFFPNTPKWKNITIHHLLAHTSGIPSFTDFPVYDTIKHFPLNHTQIIALFKDKSTEFEPGTKFSYSNSGYIILSEIISKVSGLTYKEFIEERIFKKCDMRNSGVLTSNEEPQNLATGTHVENGKFMLAEHIDMNIPSGAGALYSTTEDLFKFHNALMGNKLLTKESLSKLTKPNLEKYGYGVIIDNISGHNQIAHSGGIDGFATWYARYPEEDICIVVLQNADNLTLFSAPRIVRAITLGLPYSLPVIRKEIKIKPEIFDKYVGSYEFSPEFKISVFKDADGKFMSQATGQDKVEIYPETDKSFFLKVVDAQLIFESNSKGRIEKLTLIQNGRKMSGKRVDN